MCDCSDSNKTESIEKLFVWLTSTDECEWHGVGENMTVSCERYHICITMFCLCVQLVMMVVESLVSQLVSFLDLSLLYYVALKPLTVLYSLF